MAPPKLKSGGTYAIANMNGYYLLTYPPDFPKHKGVGVDESFSAKTAELQSWVVEVVKESPLTISFSNPYHPGYIVLPSEKPDTELQVYSTGQPKDSDLWVVGANSATFPDFYRLQNAVTKTYLHENGATTKKVSGRAMANSWNQYWRFVPFDSLKDLDELHRELLSEQRKMQENELKHAETARDQYKSERDKLKEDLAKANVKSGQDDSKVKEAEKKLKECSQARQTAEEKATKAQKDRDDAENQLKHVRDQRDAAEDDIRRLRNKLDDAEYDLRKAKRDLEDAQDAERKAKRALEDAEEAARKAIRDTGNANDDAAREKRRADGAEKELKKVQEQLRECQQSHGGGGGGGGGNGNAEETARQKRRADDAERELANVRGQLAECQRVRDSNTGSGGAGSGGGSGGGTLPPPIFEYPVVYRIGVWFHLHCNACGREPGVSLYKMFNENGKSITDTTCEFCKNRILGEVPAQIVAEMRAKGQL